MAKDKTMKTMGSWDDGRSGGSLNNGKLKKQILKHLEAGKGKFLLLEHQVTGGKKVQELLEKARLTKMRLQKARAVFDKYEKQAEHYIEKNPKKAVVMAVAAGVLAGRLWSAFKGKKTAPKMKAPVLRKKRPALKP